MRSCDWSSDVCSSDRVAEEPAGISFSVIVNVGLISICCALSQARWAASVSCACAAANGAASMAAINSVLCNVFIMVSSLKRLLNIHRRTNRENHNHSNVSSCHPMALKSWPRSEEHTSELQSLMRISYDVF